MYLIPETTYGYTAIPAIDDNVPPVFDPLTPLGFPEEFAQIVRQAASVLRSNGDLSPKSHFGLGIRHESPVTYEPNSLFSGNVETKLLSEMSYLQPSFYG